jgi:rubrerythrin
MSTPDQYRAKAAEFTELARAGNAPDEVRQFQKLERSFTALADNEQWLADNHDKAVHAPAHLFVSEEVEGVNAPASPCVDEEAEEVHALERPRISEEAEGENILRCLGAALIMQWNTLPTKLQRELFDTAGAMGELLDTAALRGQIARFLHKRKDGENATTKRSFAASD